ncbi:MAG: DUF1177 domain-containing protein [Euryarchaeota archaeon]|nr:DUF1177 domain-containing protein [Euryarchaeota archaeon]
MLKQVMEIIELVDTAGVDGSRVVELLKERGADETEVKKEKSTDFVKIHLYGKNEDAPTVGIIGRLGGIGAQPHRTGIVSDADGAITALSCALKLAEMKQEGNTLNGDVIIATHICPHAPIISHEPVPFMGSPVTMEEMNRQEVDERMDAILTIDTTKGNRLLNYCGFAITPTVKEGYILRVSEDLLNIMEWTTGKPPRVFPITTQDITPYGNEVFHINSILQPSTATEAPVVGVAITTEAAVPGCTTGASHETDIEEAARYCIEVVKAFTEGKCSFYNKKEFAKLVSLYGGMRVLQTPGTE